MKKLIQKVIRTPIGQWLIAKLGSGFIRFIYWTNRWEYVGREHIEGLIKADTPALFCFWHGRMAMMPCAWQWKNPFYMLLSHHTDGKLISRVIGNFGIGSVYGSTQRRGEQAGREVLERLAAGSYIGITPDGPRGPGYQVAPGIIRLAQMANVPIIPSTHATSRRKFLRSWDRFHIPLPFGRGVLLIGEPIYATEDAEETRRLVEQSLLNLTRQADQLVSPS